MQETLFPRLFLRHQKNIYAYILSLIRNTNDADDIMQDVLTVMWRRFGEFEQGTNFQAWGIRIARNLVKEYMRKQTGSPVTFSPEVLAAIEKRGAQRKTMLSNKLEILAGCVQKLSQSERHLLELRYNESMKIKDIAVEVSRPLSGLYKAMGRIHDRLLQCLERSERSRRASL